MGHGHKFDPSKLARLKDPERFTYLNPEKIWNLLGDNINTVIDLGAGIGIFSIRFASFVPMGKVYACELSAEMLNHLQKEVEESGAKNVEAIKTEEVHVPLPDDVADALVMINLHHEFDHPEDSLRETLRLLRPGGTVAIIDWKPEETPSGPPLHVRALPIDVRKQLEATGFQNTQEHEILPYHFVTTSQKPTS